MTARALDADRTAGMDAGADFYLTNRSRRSSCSPACKKRSVSEA